jgi:hypothetical protein
VIAIFRVVNISPFLVKYIAIWASFCLVAVFILVWDRKHFFSEWREYLRFLIVPWKLWLFVPAFLFVTFAGRYTNDETWDFVTGSGMAILTFLTAPWGRADLSGIRWPPAIAVSHRGGGVAAVLQ